MGFLLTVTLALNCAITFPLAFLLLMKKSKLIKRIYGADSNARRILACMYMAIGVVSARALRENDFDQQLALAAPLFQIQCFYKTMTAFAVGPKSPVVVVNLAIVALQLYTLRTYRVL